MTAILKAFLVEALTLSDAPEDSSFDDTSEDSSFCSSAPQGLEQTGVPS